MDGVENVLNVDIIIVYNATMITLIVLHVQLYLALILVYFIKLVQ